MSTTCKNLCIPKHTSITYELVFTLDDLPVSIVGWTLYFTVKKLLTDDDIDAVITKDITEHTDAPNGITQIDLTTEDTDIDVGNYRYDIKYKTDTGAVGILTRGKFLVERTATVRQ